MEGTTSNDAIITTSSNPPNSISNNNTLSTTHKKIKEYQNDPIENYNDSKTQKHNKNASKQTAITSTSSSSSSTSQRHHSQKQQKHKSPKHQHPTTAFLCGLTAGVTQAGFFNPYDRALYLSVKHRRPFLSYINFTSPYLGFLQSVSGRALSGGLFFPLESLFSGTLKTSSTSQTKNAKQKNDFANFLAGSGAGAASAFLLNPLSAIKYRTWGRETNRGVIAEAIIMWTKGGIRPFFHGLLPTLSRDVAFGGTYTFLRLHVRESNLLEDHPKWVWAGDTASAALAAVVSGPFNLARNVQYATRASKQQPSIVDVLTALVREAWRKGTFWDGSLFLQRRLRIGWGTARVAAGMAFGQRVYDFCVECSTASSLSSGFV